MLDLVAAAVYVVVTTLIGFVTVAVIYARWHYGTLERLKGLPAVVTPAFVGGSDIHVYKKIVHHQDTANVKKYGKLYGYYEGRFPHIYIADPELIRLIFIKDFDHFQNKRIMDFGHPLVNEMMDILPYKKWKVVRNALSPSLTTGKLRNMSIQMVETIESWMGTVMDKMAKNEPFIPKRLYTALTADITARCGFGTKVNSLHDPNNPFVQYTKKIAGEEEEMNFMLTVTHTFPQLMRFVPFFPPGTLEFFAEVLQNAMRTRKEQGIKINDFVDALNDMIEKTGTEEYKQLGITELTVMCQSLFFFLAGFETSASTLTYLTYNLANNPDVQDKLIAEVDAYLDRHDGKIEHETIGELTYLSACLQESLRLFAPLIRIERVCTKEWYHEPSGLRIPKGMCVQVPTHAVHYNEEYYPEPTAFKPERFLPENKDKLNPNAFLPFGSGPHNCVGLRFAKEQVLLAMTHILKNFKFRPNAETKINWRKGRTFLMNVEPFTVDAISRI